MTTGRQNGEEFTDGGVVPLTCNLYRPGIPRFDAEEFREYVDGFDITEEQKIEYLQALWSIAVAFADIAFGTDSAQRILSPLGDFSSASESDTVEQKGNVQQLNRASWRKARKDEAHGNSDTER